MKITNWLDEHFEEVIMTVLLIGIACVMFLQVIARYVFKSPLSWSDELARYMLVWSGFFSVSFCVKKRISIKIDQFQNSLSEKVIPFIKMIRHTLVFIYCLIMIPFTLTYLQQAIASGATSAAMKLPMYYIQASPLVCFLLLAIRVAQAWIRECKASWKNMVQTIKDELRDELLNEIKEEQKGGEGK